MYLRVLFSEVMLKDISLAMHKEINDTKNRPKKKKSRVSLSASTET